MRRLLQRRETQVSFAVIKVSIYTVYHISPLSYDT